MIGKKAKSKQGNKRKSAANTDVETCASLAQLDRVPGYEPGGRRFESSRTRHYLEKASLMRGFLYLMFGYEIQHLSTVLALPTPLRSCFSV